MNQVIEITDKEKHEMYSLLDKEQLIKMLIEANKQLDRITKDIKPIYDTSNLESFNGLDFTDEEMSGFIKKFDMFETDEGDEIAVALTNYKSGLNLPDCGKFYWDEEKSLFTFKLY